MSADSIFDPALTEQEVATRLSQMTFSKIAQAHSAHVFGDLQSSLVIKVFPAATVGNAQDLAFIQKNTVLRTINQWSLYWGNLRVVQFLRKQAKSAVTVLHSRRNVEFREPKREISIEGYEVCIRKGLMAQLQTRVIPNCMSTLSFTDRKRVPQYLLHPKRIVVQKRFSESDVVLEQLRKLSRASASAQTCRLLITKAVEYQKMMWRKELICTDLSFNVFENLIVLSNGELQIHDADGVTESLGLAKWFIREKEKDLNLLFSRIHNGGYPAVLFETNFATVAESARKLYHVLPQACRDSLVMLFLSLAKATLCEGALIENWAQCRSGEIESASG